MKKISIYLIILILMLSIFSPISGTNSNAITEKNDSDNNLFFSYSFGTPEIKTSEVLNEKITRINLDGLPLSREPGHPCLPVKPLRILLPQSTTIKSISVEIQEINTIQNNELKHVEIAGIPSPINHYSKLKQTYDISYDSSAIYPSKIYENLGVQFFRGCAILNLNIYPVRYLGKTNTLFFYSEIKIRLETIPTSQNNLYQNDVKKDIVRMVENPGLIEDYQNIKTNGFTDTSSFDYVIITTEDLQNISGVDYSFEDLLDYRRSQGLNCTLKTVESIIDEYEGVDVQEKIRNFIKDAYMNWNTRWVLLGGDVEKVPIRYLYDIDGVQSDEEEVASDLYYQCLDGNYNYDGDGNWGEKHDGENGNLIDLYAEVYIGRAPADNKYHVSAFVEKTLSYENSQWDESDYLKNHLSVGEILWNGLGGYGAGYAERCIDYCTDYNQNTHGIPTYKYTVTELYERDMVWDSDDFLNEIDNGVNIINHVSHGSSTSASIDINEIFSLTNEDKYPLFYSQACHAGSLDKKDECFAERWVNVDQKGGFAAIMNTGYGYGTSGDYDGPDNRYAREFFDALFSPYEKISRLGEANQDSKEDNYWQINNQNMYHVYYDTLLFGDPYVEIKGAEDITADFSWNIEYPITGQSINFIDESIGEIDYRNWEFGDGHTSNQKNPTHQYSYPKKFQVTLTVQDTYGFLSTTTKQIEVKDEWLPFAIASPAYYQGYDFTVEFIGDQSWDPDGNIVSYYWDFDDGDISYLPNTNHTYSSEGTYHIAFTVTDNDGNINRVFCEIVLDNQFPPLDPNIPNGPVNLVSGDTYTYTVITEDPEADKIKYGWDWGDETPIQWSEWYNSSEPCTMSHMWNSIGKSNIRVKARDINNAESDWSDTLEVTIEDNTDPTLEFIIPEKAIYISNKKIIPFFSTIIFGTIEINVSAYDSSGITMVEFYVDGEPKIEVLSKPYTFIWSEKSFGKHILKTIAYDNAGNIAEKEIKVWKFS